MIDHLGNTFETGKEMCKYWGVNYGTYKSRIKAGETQESALLGLHCNQKRIQDPNGKGYLTEAEMCRDWGVSYNTYLGRKKKGYTLIECLQGKEKFILDPYGTKFKNEKAMAEAYGINYATFVDRKYAGVSLKENLNTKRVLRKNVTDHLGNKFRSITEMCKFWGIPISAFYSRKKQELSLEECLTNPVKETHLTFPRIYQLRNGLKFTAMGISTGVGAEKRIRTQVYGEFEDGLQMTGVSANGLQAGKLTYPGFTKNSGSKNFHGFEVKKYCYEIKDDSTGLFEVYYPCNCKQCGGEFIMTLMEMVEHSKYCNI